MPKSVEEKAREAYESEYGRTSDGKIIYVKDLYSGGFDEFLEIFRRDYNAEGGLIKRVGLRGGKDAAQSDFGAGPGETSSDAGFANTSPSRVSTINVTDRPVFDITKVGDPALNPKSKNVNVKDDRFSGYTPSFAPKPSFMSKAFTKGKTFLEVARPFLGTFLNVSGINVPKGVRQAIALYSLAKNIPEQVITEEAEDGIGVDDRQEFKGGGIKKIPIRSNKYGVKELDYRKSGGFVPIGVKEKADDVPAMLSKNEFVFTADAVRGAGNGSINKGAQKMYNLMKNLEARRV